jgi:hypothetical protein
MREFINRYGVYIIAGAVVVTVLSFWFFRPLSGPRSAATKAYYVDEETGEKSEQPIGSIPPLMGKSGKPTLVRVVMVSCQSNGKNAQEKFYQRYAPQAHAKIMELQGTSDPDRLMELDDLKARAEQVRLPAPGSKWVLATSEEGQKIRDAAAQCTNGEIAREVYPD